MSDRRAEGRGTGRLSQCALDAFAGLDVAEVFVEQVPTVGLIAPAARLQARP